MLRTLVDFLAKMGLAVRDDPPKVIDFGARQWGEARGGWALSVETIQGSAPGDLPSLSVVIRNMGPVPQTLNVPGWLHFYTLELRDGKGKEVPMAAFGNTALNPSRRTEKIEAELQPDGWTETLIPLGSFFNLRGQSGLTATARATVSGSTTLVSNTTTV